MIEVCGTNRKLKSKITNFTEWLCYRLLGERLAPNVAVTIIVSKFEDDEVGFHGFAEYEDCNIRPREFLVRLNKKLSEEDLMETLAHEMVHVKQIARGERQERYRGGYKVIWKGVDHTNTPYSKQPWERQAYRMEKKLVKEYLMV